MRKYFNRTALGLVAAVLQLQAATASAGDPVPAWEPVPAAAIVASADIFAIISEVGPSRLDIATVNTVMSRDGATILFPGDRIEAVIEPLVAGNTRRAVCVTAIHGRHGEGRVTPFGRVFPREGCLAQLHDYEGRVGLPAAEIRVGLPVRVRLNGDLVLEPLR